MLTFKIYHSLRSVKKAWNEIIKDSHDIYQGYEFARICYFYRITSLSNIKNNDISCFL